MIPLADFQFQDHKGRLYSQDHFKGKVLLMDFWNTWCGACYQKFPELNQIHQNFALDSTVCILAVNTAQYDSLAYIKKFTQKYSYEFMTVLDVESRLSKLLGVEVVPMTFLVDKKGYVRLIHFGYGGKDEQYAKNFINEINKLLTEQ
ncbi:MAG: TlpA disulfide reductase family protein [Microscillaceae bacterium]|nr:TlpA disulfide reductase family protein [Microscillaceae bacterium]